MIEAGIIGLCSSLVGVTLGKLLIHLQLKRRIRIATEIADKVTAENNGVYDPNLIRAALDERDPRCRLMRVYFNHVQNKEVQPA